VDNNFAAAVGAPIAQLNTEVAASLGGLQQLLAWRVTDDEGFRLSGMWATQLADLRDSYAQRREGGFAPLRALWDWCESLFPKSTLKLFDQCIDHLKTEAKSYHDARKAEAIAALPEARTHAELQQATAAITGGAPVGMVEVESWTFKVVDPNAIPREYWVLDEKRLASEAKKQKARLSVPGVVPVRETDFRRAARR
jgi:hypothetical protein